MPGNQRALGLARVMPGGRLVVSLAQVMPGKRPAAGLARVTRVRMAVSLPLLARAPVTRARTVTPPTTLLPGSCPRISRRDSAGGDGSWAAGTRRIDLHSA
jgi:hypothetical protein